MLKMIQKEKAKMKADTEAGNSGSPVFCYYDGSPTVIATHISGYADAISQRNSI